MLAFQEEQKAFKNGYKVIGALDEAGRGPLAGPVVAACVVAREDFNFNCEKLEQINDSKKLSAKKREELFEIIQENFQEVGIGICDQQTIDKINILEASFLAMKKALGSLKTKPDFIILDGKFLIPNISTAQKAIIRGDSLVLSIAAASIIAKVTRDRMMRQMHEAYPDYGFDQHKGYGTKYHLEQLSKFGPCQIHRKSFEPIRRLLTR